LNAAVLRIDQVCRMAIDGRRAGRLLSEWARSFDLSEPELQLMWCMRQERSDGVDQTTIATRLAFSAAQVSVLVERLHAHGWIMQRLVVGDRRRRQWRLSGDGQAVIDQLLVHVNAEVTKKLEAARPPKTGGVSGRVAAALVLLAGLTCLSGCTRAYYRKQADAEVNCIIDHKAEALGSAPGEFRIDVDPRSRMFDPDDPDCPPMPPDDPISHQLMNCIDCKPGAPCWRHAPHTPYADNPNWEEFLPRDNEGQVVLDMQGAVQMALLQSTDYQEQLETLYLSSLDVTFERFRFDTQYFSASNIFFNTQGRNRTGNPSGSSELSVSPIDFEARK
jgi:DNA-binding MarR family transcriptional regulator